MSALYRHAPGTIWRHALARHDRRAALIQWYRLTYPELGPYVGLTREYQLLREAARLANRLAYCAGIVDPYAA